MPPLRTDPLFARSVLFAPRRNLRPSDFEHDDGVAAADWGPPQQGHHTYRATCPFCQGNESATPKAVAQYPSEPARWKARIVPNRFAAVAPDDQGGHEVIIESPNHFTHLSQLSPEDLQGVLAISSRRLTWWREEENCHFVTLFKNLGPRAGASLAHLHSQLVALPTPPLPLIEQEKRLQDHFTETGVCAICARLAEAEDASSRTVACAGPWIAYCPEISLFPYETWIASKEHEPRLERAMVGHSGQSLAQLLLDVIGRLERLRPDICFNVAYQSYSTPGIEKWYGALHGTIQITPRLSSLAGLELGSQIHINHLSAAEAAAALRQA